MPPKKEGKEKKPKNQGGGGGGAMRERTDDELKNSPNFNKIFVNEVLKQSTNPEEKAFIQNAFKQAADHDDFNMRCFDIDWFLERYEELFNLAKQQAMKPQPKKEEPPVMKQEPYPTQEEDPSRYLMNSNLNVKFEPAYGSYSEPYQHPGMAQHPTGAIYASMNPQMPQMSPQMAPQMPQMNPQMGTQMKSAYPNPADQYPPPYNYPPQPQAQPQGQRMPHMNQYGQTAQQPYMAQAQPTQAISQQQQPLMPVQPQQMPAIPTQPQTPQTPLQQTGRVPMEKEEPALIKHQLQTEFETNMQLRQKLSSIVPLNAGNMLNFLAHKVNKKATDGFYNGLYLAVADYAKNLLDELRIICEMDNDAGDMSTYQKSTTTGTNQSNGSMEIESAKNVLMGSDGTSEPKPPKSGQYLIRFSSLQEDQKQIEKLDDREQKDLEERYTMSKDDDEEKITKKVKKDFTEEDEIIKFLFKTKKDKNQDNESYNKRIKETNMFLDRVTSRLSYSMTTAASAGDQGSQKQTGKGRKGGGGQKRVSMKHLIYYLETNPLYKRTPLLHKAYLK